MFTKPSLNMMLHYSVNSFTDDAVEIETLFHNSAASKKDLNKLKKLMEDFQPTRDYGSLEELHKKGFKQHIRSRHEVAQKAEVTGEVLSRDENGTSESEKNKKSSKDLKKGKKMTQTHDNLKSETKKEDKKVKDEEKKDKNEDKKEKDDKKEGKKEETKKQIKSEVKKEDKKEEKKSDKK